MKTRFLTLLSLVALFVFSACEKDPKSGPDDGTNGVTALNVPAGFDWVTATDVLCAITAPEGTMLSVALSAAAEPFALFEVGGDAEAMTLSIPTWVTTLYVSYSTVAGMSAPQAVAITGSTLSFTVPAEAVAASFSGGTRAMTKAAVVPYVTYPAAGWGTLMFEDLWPAYGDFDFNDLVVAYQIKLFPQNKNMGRQMEVAIQVRAVGGSLPNTLYLSLRGVKGGEIDRVTKLEEANAQTPTALVATNNANNVLTPAILRFDHIRTSSQQPRGVAYVNTMPGGEMTDGQMLSARYYVEFRNSIKKEDIVFETFDFFIARTDIQKEIHMGGFSPLLYGDDVYNALALASTGKEMVGSPGYYYSKDRLVWGMTVPALIPHAYEKIDFTKAYPNFANWVQSGGAMHADWYTDVSGNRVNSNLVNP